MAEWWSIEVFSGDRLPASGWRYAYEDELTEAAITHGARYYEWHDTEFGVLFEILFDARLRWELGVGTPGQDGPGTDAPGTDAPGTDVPGTEIPGAEPVSRDMAAFDRSVS